MKCQCMDMIRMSHQMIRFLTATVNFPPCLICLIPLSHLTILCIDCKFFRLPTLSFNWFCRELCMLINSVHSVMRHPKLIYPVTVLECSTSLLTQSWNNNQCISSCKQHNPYIMAQFWECEWTLHFLCEISSWLHCSFNINCINYPNCSH